MGTPYVGEIRMFGGNFAPAGWALCDGRLLAISNYDVLFNLIGTTYGGNGASTFALPDLRGRIPMHQGPGFVLAQSAGTETVTLTIAQIPAHSHVPQCNANAGNQASPAGGVWASSSPATIYDNAAPSIAMAATAVGSAGGSQPHENRMPFLAVNFIISLFGIYPSIN